MKFLAMFLFLILSTALAQTPLNIGYTPTLSAAQLFVSVGEDFYEEAGLELSPSEFQSGAATVQALSDGELDAAYIDVGLALEVKAKDIPIKVVAASVREEISFVAQGDLAQYFTEDRTVAQAFQRFIDMEGKPAQIATLPVGTVSETVLQAWLDANGVPAGDVEIFYMDNSQLERALEAQAVTAAAVVGPEAGVALDTLEAAQILASGAELLVAELGAVLIVRDELSVEQPEVVQALVNAHVRSTNVLNTDPERAARSVETFLGEELEPIITTLSDMQAEFIADPNAIRVGTQALHDFQVAAGTLEQEVFLDELFDTRFFGAADEE